MEPRALSDGELEQAWELEREAFNAPAGRRELFLRHAVAAHFTGAFEDGSLVCMARALPMAQFFGGRPVSMGGVASVATAAHVRGRGLGKRVMKRCLERMREDGYAISSLHPATTSLYRALGWEVAGSLLFRTLEPRAADGVPAPSAGRLRPADPGDPAEREAIRVCYRRFAERCDGQVDRSAERWSFLFSVWDGARIFVFEDDAGEVAGYGVYRQVAGRWGELGGPFRLVLTDWVALSGDASLALWRLLGSWSSQVHEVIYRAPADDPVLLLLPEQRLGVLAELRTMTRLVDAPAAIEARGFPPGVSAEVSLLLRDPILAGNEGAFVLQVKEGRGRLERGGAGRLEVDVGAFSSLYTGWSSAQAMARAGRLGGGSADDCASLDAVFAGPAPWMLDDF